MVFVPLIFFSILLFYFWTKHKYIDTCIYICGLYVVTAISAVWLVLTDSLGDGGILYDTVDDAEFGFIPTVLFCILIGASLLPFSMFYDRDIKKITPVKNQIIVDVICWFLIIVAFLNFYLVIDSFADLLQGDLKELRDEHYSGEVTLAEIKAESLPAILQYFNYLNKSTLLALPIFFYNISFLKKAWWFNTLILISSLSVPISGIQSVDRTELVFYMQMFLYCMIFYYRFLSKKIKRAMFILGTPVLAVFLVYLVAVSQARFEEQDGGASTSAMQYGGQGYINFCYFWEEGDKNIFSAEREFPFIGHFIFKVDSDPDRREDRSGEQGFYISVFATFIGDVLLDLGPFGLIVWVFAFMVITTLIIKRPHRNEFTIGEILLIFYLSVIPIFGIFYYRFFNYQYTIMLILILIIYVSSKYEIRLK